MVSPLRIATLSALLASGAAGPALAEILPSTGADGPLVVTANQTLALPPDGVFHFTTVAINAATVVGTGVLNFSPNASNTPVQIRATGDVVIDGTVTVSTSGNKLGSQSGGPGGAPGGNGGFGSTPPLPGGGPSPGMIGLVPIGAGGGGGLATAGLQAIRHLEGLNAGLGGDAVPFPVPLTGGSSGAGGNGDTVGGSPLAGAFGGGAGGAIRIDTPGRIIVNGSITANGAWGETAGAAFARAPGGGGSGGVIDLHANEIEFGASSLLQAIGGPGGGLGSIPSTDPNFSSGADGGQGYVRLEGRRIGTPIIDGVDASATSVPATGTPWQMVVLVALLVLGGLSARRVSPRLGGRRG